MRLMRTGRLKSAALYSQAVLQGAFILAKAKHGPRIRRRLHRSSQTLFRNAPASGWSRVTDAAERCVTQATERELKEETIMTEQKITPCLWYDFNAEEAVAFYRP